MAKCMRCGKSTLLLGNVKLADGSICYPCMRKLGFESYEQHTLHSNKYDDIKDGKDELTKKIWEKKNVEYNRKEAARLGLFYSDYKTLDHLDCSDNEMKAVERVCALLADEGCDPKKIEFEREPGAPLSAFIGDNKLFELKYTKDVKWIRIGDDENKHRITGPAGINKLVNKLVEAYNR